MFLEGAVGTQKRRFEREGLLGWAEREGSRSYCWSFLVVVTMIVASVSVVVPIKLKPLANDAGAA